MDASNASNCSAALRLSVAYLTVPALPVTPPHHIYRTLGSLPLLLTTWKCNLRKHSLLFILAQPGRRCISNCQFQTVGAFFLPSPPHSCFI